MYTGALVANGTMTQTITLTGVVASPGSWGGISARGTAILPARVDLDYASLSYGGSSSGSDGAQVYADQAVVTITHSIVQNSAGHGVYISLSARLDAHETSFVNNGKNAIQLNQPSTDLMMTGLNGKRQSYQWCVSRRRIELARTTALDVSRLTLHRRWDRVQ